MARKWLLPVVFGLMVISIACASAPAPQASTSTPQPKPSVSSPSTPSASSEDAAWAKVVEAARKEGRLTIYAASMVGNVGLVVSRAFEERYGIKVDIINGRGAELVERIRTEQRMDNVVAGVVEGAATHVLSVKLAGGTVSSMDIPILRDKKMWRIQPLAVDPEGHLLSHRAYFLTAYVNTDLVIPGKEPKSYADMLDARWKGKIVATDPLISSGAYDLFVTMMRRNSISEETVKAIGKQIGGWARDGTEVAQFLARGEFPLGFPSADMSAAPFLEAGAQIRPIDMDEGVIPTMGAVAAVKNTRQPNAAKLFINWMLTQEGQTVYSKELGLASVRNDVADFRHPKAQIEAKRLLANSGVELDEIARLFREKYIAKLWGR